MPSKPSPDNPPVITPRFGRLMLVCALGVIFCGFMVWLMGEKFPNCCDLSWLDRLSPS